MDNINTNHVANSNSNSKSIVKRQSNHLSIHEDKNDFFEKIRKIMNDPHFRDFFKTYFKELSDTKISLMFMHTYCLIEEEFEAKYKQKLSSDDTIKILKKMFYNVNIRKIMIDSVNNFIEHNTSYKDTYSKAIHEYVDESKLLTL